MAAGCLGIATWFALQGLWVPLPFAGAEVLVLGYCWRRVLRAGDEHETIEVTPQRVVVASDRHGGTRQRCDFQTCWTRVELAGGAYRGYPRRLLLGSHGKRLEVGRFLPEQERERLYGELTASIRAVGI